MHSGGSITGHSASAEVGNTLCIENASWLIPGAEDSRGQTRTQQIPTLQALEVCSHKNLHPEVGGKRAAVRVALDRFQIASLKKAREHVRVDRRLGTEQRGRRLPAWFESQRDPVSLPSWRPS